MKLTMLETERISASQLHYINVQSVVERIVHSMIKQICGLGVLLDLILWFSQALANSMRTL